MSEPDKPKRGRKPKNSVVGETAEKGKRGRKPRVVYNSFENGEMQNMSEDENIIMKLNVSHNDVESDDASQEEYDAYNDISAASYCDANFSMLESYQEEKVVEEPMSDHSRLKVIELLKDFEEKN